VEKGLHRRKPLILVAAPRFGFRDALRLTGDARQVRRQPCAQIKAWKIAEHIGRALTVQRAPARLLDEWSGVVANKRRRNDTG